jgi:ArsR family transcriptional regulator
MFNREVNNMKPGDDTCQEYSVNPQTVSEALSRIPNDETLGLLTKMFQALADSNRLKIMLSVSHNEVCVCELAEVLSMSAPAVSHHLRRLKDMGLVRTRRDGKLVYYALDDDHVRELLFTALTHLEHRHQK